MRDCVGTGARRCASRRPRAAARGSAPCRRRCRRGAAAARGSRGRRRARRAASCGSGSRRRVVVAARLRDQPALDEIRDGRVGRDAADARDVRPRARPEVRDDRERLERRLREVPLRRLLEEPRARLRRLARRAERPAARDVLEHDAAAALAVALADEPERRLDALGVVVRGLRELLRRTAAPRRRRAAPRSCGRAGRADCPRSGGAERPRSGPFVSVGDSSPRAPR